MFLEKNFFFNLSMYLCCFFIISLWKRTGSFIWTNLSSPKDVLCQVWLKLVQWFLRRRFLKFCQCILLLNNYLLLEKDRTLIWTNLGPLHPSLVEIDPVVLEKMKMWKVSDNNNKNDAYANDGQRTNLSWAFSSGELKRPFNANNTLHVRPAPSPLKSLPSRG